MDEDSMTGRLFWAWFRHRIEEGRKIPPGNIDGDNIAQLNVKENNVFPLSIYERSWCGIPLVYSYEGCYQLSPVGMRLLSDLRSTTNFHRSDCQASLAMKDSLESIENVTKSCAVVMNEFMRQRYGLLKNVLNNVRNGTMDDASVGFLLRHCLNNLSATEKLLLQTRHYM